MDCQETSSHLDRMTWVTLLVALTVLAGCTRRMYRRQADREVNYLLREKSVDTPWELARRYSVMPDVRSRFFDPTNPDFPTLPSAGPSLFEYQLPLPLGRLESPVEDLPPSLPLPDDQPELPIPDDQLQRATSDPGPEPGNAEPIEIIKPVGFLQEAAAPETSDGSEGNDPFADSITGEDVEDTNLREVTIQQVKPAYWDDLPPECLARLLEFRTSLDEYKQTFHHTPSSEQLDNAPRLTLHDLFQIALINSREYQRQKELLYRAALTLSLERYAYATKFTTRGNGVDTTYLHQRNRGITNNTLRVPSSLEGDKLLATGGTILGRFANSVILTFNGPQGFSADVSSELLFNFTQRVFQRDIILNRLIQSERDLVYAVRRFARYRKQFFLDVAVEYYTLLRTYRNVEIDTQNYLAQVRNFQQAQEEVSSDISSAPSPISVNQFEQGVLRTRSALIRSCNVLEQGLDDLKMTMGIPTETPINIDLTELDQLTLRDSIEVERERARRWMLRLESFRQKAAPADHADILNADSSLADQLLVWLTKRTELQQSEDLDTLARLRAQFRLDVARVEVTDKEADLKKVQDAAPPAPRVQVLQRQLDVIAARLQLIHRQGQFALRTVGSSVELDEARRQFIADQSEYIQLGKNFDLALKDPDKMPVNTLLDKASLILAKLRILSQDLDHMTSEKPTARVVFQQTLARTDTLLKQTKALFEEAGEGLPPIDISADQAMVTALVQRLDLMNQRGTIADNWREIKLAADELRSFLNLNAEQVIRTDKNRPFGFSMRDSQTQLAMSFDLPLNRRAQRNLYRRSLLDYNFELRNLMEREDSIKLRIRREMRNLEQARVQYPISVARAALAQEQVRSTRLQLVLGLAGVRALDLLAAFADSRDALGQVADARIGYIIERANFAFELEAIMLNDQGFWPDINDNEYQPKAKTDYPWNAGSAYGDFPSYLKVSHELQRMLDYPPPGSADTNPKQAHDTVDQDR